MTMPVPANMGDLSACKTATGQSAMVACGNPLAALAAQRMLEVGGSAIDAAIAADAVMGVVEPMATSIGGDLLAMVCSPQGEVVSYNGTGRAPLALTSSRIADLPDGRIPERHALSVTTPGAVRGWSDLHLRFGRLPWASLFAPAIEHAGQGFPVAQVAAREWKLFDHVLHQDSHCAALYLAGNPPSAGQIFRNPELAAVLEAIADHGPDAFYRGWIAQAASQAVCAHDGVLGVRDFEQHLGHFCEPVIATFHGYKIHQCPPNTHGVAILHALANIEAFGGQPQAHDTWGNLVSATAQAMKYASKTVRDPSGNTVCSVIVDRQGLAVTLMSSIFKRFGSAIAVPGAGFVLQNRGFGFSSLGHINGPAPGKRPYHTVVPGITTRDGHFYLGMGVVGGLMQPQGQIQILTRHLAWKQDIQEAINAPRVRLEAKDTLAIEQGTHEDLIHYLRSSGYPEPSLGVGDLAGRSDFGGAHAIVRHSCGQLQGVADPRKDGIALAC